MFLPKPVAAAAAVTAAFAIGATATSASSATVITPTVDIGSPAVLVCPTWYGRNNPADGACLPWCDSRNIAPCSAPY
jgi:hypothetical protein